MEIGLCNFSSWDRKIHVTGTLHSSGFRLEKVYCNLLKAMFPFIHFAMMDWVSTSWFNLHIQGKMTVISTKHWKTGPSWPNVLIPHRSIEKWKQRTNLRAYSHSTVFKDKDSNSCSGICDGWRDTAKCKHPPVEVAIPLIKQEVRKEDRGTGMSSNSCETVVKE